MYTDNRDAYRQSFYIAWQKYQKNLPLETVEKQLVEVILFHPEYHDLLNHSAPNNQEFTLEENPFFHMSLHIALREQLKLNRPFGIKEIFEQLATHHTPHDVEHLMTACLAQALWEAQQTGIPPDENKYLARLKEIK